MARLETAAASKRPQPRNGDGIDMPMIGTWIATPMEHERREVDFDRIPVLYLADGRALVRKAGF